MTMEKISPTEKKYCCLDYHSIAQLLESSFRLLGQKLELRDARGNPVIVYPAASKPDLPTIIYQDLHNQLTAGKTQKCTFNNKLIIGLPILRESHFMGSLIIVGENNSGFDTESIKFYQVITDYIAKEFTSQIEVNSLSEELAIRYEELNLFYKVGEWLKGVQETEESIQLIIDKITETLEVEHGFITLPNKEIFTASGTLENCQGAQNNTHLKKLGKELLKIFSINKLIILNQVDEHPILKNYFPPSSSLVAVPITINGIHQGALGICCMLEIQHKKFTTGDVRLLYSMAEVISILLKNTELYQNLKTFLVTVVKCLVSAIEAKDIYTRGHSERVNCISSLIANYMELPQKVKESINWASMLHDIGKIGIPEAILTKPGRLTNEEFDEIKKHPERGYIILKPIQGFKPALDGVRFHQERFDGRGYPKGLKGKQIPLGARIIAIADTYDAITSSRAYRKSLSHEEAIAEIRKVAGSQLDPDLVKIFLELVESKGQQILKQKNSIKNEN